MHHRSPFYFVLLFGVFASAGCSHDPGGTELRDLAGLVDLGAAAGADLTAVGPDGDPQTPPTSGGTELTAWLQRGYYKSWHCEMAAHPPGPHGAHGTNRICSNNVLAAAPATGEYPVGSASVKELYSGTSISGYALALRVQAGAGSTSWYWNEFGSGGVGIPGCANCHSQAGSGGTFTGKDYVFVRVP